MMEHYLLKIRLILYLAFWVCFPDEKNQKTKENQRAEN